MEESIYETEPPSEEDLLLLGEFRREIIRQGERVDDLAKELFKMELAVPGVYIALLKTFEGRGIGSEWVVAAVFACWAIAVCLTIFELFPRTYRILEGVVDRASSPFPSRDLTIRDYFVVVAGRKRRLLIISCFAFFAGVALAALTLFGG